jgi:ABC-type transport system involved in multi-copper enzyme maturation permease subunit
MKFLAILRDSLREAIDTKVFYVMVALSGLLALFAFGIGFKPRPAQDAFTWIANTTLNPELTQDLDPERFMNALLRIKSIDAYEIVEAEPLDGKRYLPDNRFRILLRRLPVSGLSALLTRLPGSQLEGRVREHFGKLGGLRLVDVEGVKTLHRGDAAIPASLRSSGGDFYEVTTAPADGTRLLWPNDVSILFGLVPIETGVPLGFQLYFIESALVIGIGGWVAILTSIIITAFFIPNMLRKGTVDLLLVKPVRRSTLLVYKYIGGLTFIFLNTAVAVGGVWLALSLRSGVWATGFLWTILILTFFFAILYAVSTLFSVLTQSPVATILLTCGVWFFLFLVGLGYQLFEQARAKEGRRAAKEHREPAKETWFPKTVQAVHFILPRTSDLGVLNSRLLSRELITANQLSGRELDQTRINWGEGLTVSAIFIAVMLGLACWWFSTKDY